MEWENYKTIKVEDNTWNNAYHTLTTVYHVAHVETALRIVKDKKVKAGLVFDKSKLNRERILVNWLSPNTWSNGSRYGNIGFEMDFKKLIEYKNFYWVETMTEYNVHALRILITPHEYANLVPYDPVTNDGPWRYEPCIDTHFWNSNHCLEFMHEGDLMVSDFSHLQYYDHHKHFCCIDHTSCSDKNLPRTIAQTRFVARIIAENVRVHRAHFTIYSENQTEANDQLKGVIGQLYMYTIEKKCYPDGLITFDDPLASSYIQSLLLFFSLKQYDEFYAFVKLFKSQEDFRGALILKAAEVFGLTSIANLNWQQQAR